METGFEPGQNIPMETLRNLRDMGGYRTADGGYVRPGLLYRSADLFELVDSDHDALTRMGIRTVFDLRTDEERVVRPGRELPDSRQVVLDVLADDSDDVLGRVREMLADPALAAELLSNDQGRTRLLAAYGRLVTLGTARESYRGFLNALAHEPTLPALFHCASGKDRTGWAAAVLLLLLGVSEEDVRADYMLTNDQLLPTWKPALDAYVAGGGDLDAIFPLVSVHEEYLDAAIDEMNSRYGSLEGYLKDGLGLDDATLQSIRATFVTHD